MTDIDYCDGHNCSLNKICARFADYLHRKENKQPVNYAMHGWSDNNCPQFKTKEFYGD